MKWDDDRKELIFGLKDHIPAEEERVLKLQKLLGDVDLQNASF